MASSRTRSKNATQFCSLPLRGSIFGISKRGRRRRRRMQEMQERVGEPDVPVVSLSSSEDDEGASSLRTEDKFEAFTEIKGPGIGVVTEGKRRRRRGLKGKRAAEPDVIFVRESSNEEDKGVSFFRTEKNIEAAVTEIKGSGFGAETEGKQRSRRGLKGEKVAELDFMYMGECVDTGELGSGFGSKRRKESSVCIEIEDDDDTEMGKQGPVHVVDVKQEVMSENAKCENFGNGRCDLRQRDSDGGQDNEVEHVMAVSSSEIADSGSDGDEGTEENRFQGVVDGGGREKSEGGKVCFEFDDAGPKFRDDGSGWVPKEPIVIDLGGNQSEDESSETQSGSADSDDNDDDDDDDIWSSSESEDDNSNDEDYRVEEVAGSNCESSSYESSSDDDDENQKHWGRYRSSGCSRPCNDQAHEDKKKQYSFRFHHNVSSHKRTTASAKVDDDSERVDNSERNSPIADANDCVIGNLGTQGGGGGEHHEKNGFEEKDDDTHQVDTPPPTYGEKPPLKGNFKEDEPLEKSESNEELDKFWAEMDMGLRSDGEGSVVRIASSLPRKQYKMGGKSAKLADANDRVNVNPGTQGGKEHHGKGSVVRNVSSLPRKQDKMRGESDEHKIRENGRRILREQTDSSFHEKKAWVGKGIGHKDGHHRVHRIPLKRKDQRLLDLLAECLLGKQKEIKGDTNGFEEKDADIPQVDTLPPACGEKPPLKWNFKDPEPVKKSESEEELEALWVEMNLELRSEKINSQVDDYPTKGSRNRALSGVDNVLHSNDSWFNVSDGDKDAVSPQNEGTVWDLIPDIKQNLYPHQQEGFEFIWTNLAGTMNRQDLKTADPCSAGGCIISHAPGTGKTRLTMVFLQTYLEVFPKCRPVIIAPSNILLTWEDEFKKWKLGVPFHNLNTLELSGREHLDASKEVCCNRSPQNNKDAVRMAKLYSWFKEKSILGISYQLFEKLAGGNSKKKNRKNHESIKENPEAETSVMEKVLLEIPGLLVLDEGHTPRNERSSIWKALSRIQTQKRIILSGTPFQNNFVELYNTLCLVKPSFPDMIPLELKKFCQSRLRQLRKTSEGLTWEPVYSGNNTAGNSSDERIKQLKRWMDPFVHVHKGIILQENLPGLRDCVLILKPDSLQKEILESIESSQNTLNFEYKLALASVHPSLFISCGLTEKEESIVDRDQLEKLRLDAYVGAKTRFLIEFLRLCEVVNEKVLVFSQFIDPLNLIMDQLKSILGWDEGKEVVLMSGKLDQKKKQHLIHGFNDKKSEAKVLLASTKACSEGINLVGASRVVLLDVVWNPSVERQAISRAYRLGQTKVVYTYHLIIQDTAESAKYCKQAEKDRLSELVFSAGHTEVDETRSGAVNLEDKLLDKLIEHEKLKDLFGKCVVQPKERDLIESFGSGFVDD